jgi:hypothetical protein
MKLEVPRMTLDDVPVADRRNLVPVDVVNVEVHGQQPICIAPLQPKEILATGDDDVRGVDVVVPANLGAEVLGGSPHGLISLANAEDQAPAESGLPASACSPIRGFRVICEKWSPPLTTIVRARSASKARFRCWDSARDVGYNLKIGELKVRRAPEYDDAKLIEGRCYGEDYASSILSENAKGEARS